MKFLPHSKGTCRENSPVSLLPTGHFGYGGAWQLVSSLRRNSEGRLFVSEDCKLTQANLSRYKGPWFKVGRNGNEIVLHINGYELSKIQKTTQLTGYLPVGKLYVNNAHFGHFKDGKYFCAIGDIEPSLILLDNVQYWLPRNPLEVNGDHAFDPTLSNDTPVKLGDYRLAGDYTTVRRTKSGTLEIWVGSGYGYPRGVSGAGKGVWLELKLK